MKTRTFDGIKFVNQGDKRWLTEDGKWEVSYVDDFETECDAEHPMRITAAHRREWNAMSDYERTDFALRNRDLAYALRNYKSGYLCPGNSTHFYGLWVAGAVEGDPEVVNREDTFTASADHLARFIQGKAELRA